LVSTYRTVRHIKINEKVLNLSSTGELPLRYVSMKYLLLDLAAGELYLESGDLSRTVLVSSGDLERQLRVRSSDDLSLFLL
jgi:hypothetical protein